MDKREEYAKSLERLANERYPDGHFVITYVNQNISILDKYSICYNHIHNIEMTFLGDPTLIKNYFYIELDSFIKEINLKLLSKKL